MCVVITTFPAWVVVPASPHSRKALDIPLRDSAYTAWRGVQPALGDVALRWGSAGTNPQPADNDKRHCTKNRILGR